MWPFSKIKKLEKDLELARQEVEALKKIPPIQQPDNFWYVAKDFPEIASKFQDEIIKNLAAEYRPFFKEDVMRFIDELCKLGYRSSGAPALYAASDNFRMDEPCVYRIRMEIPGRYIEYNIWSGY